MIAWEMGVAAGRGLRASGGRLENGPGNQKRDWRGRTGRQTMTFTSCSTQRSLSIKKTHSDIHIKSHTLLNSMKVHVC